jgi:hypothetical protein
MEAGKWTCPTCGSVVYPEPGIVSGSECRPCRAERQRAAEAVQKQADQPTTGGIFSRRRPA